MKTQRARVLVYYLALAFCGVLANAPSSQARTVANVILDARGYGGSGSTNSTSQSTSNLAVEASDTRSWMGSAPFGRTDSSASAWARSQVGELHTRAYGQAQAEITGSSGSLAPQGRGAALASWDDRFTVNAGPSLSNQLGELTATLVVLGELSHTSTRTDSSLSFRLSCQLTDTAGGGGSTTNFRGGTLLKVNAQGATESLPLDGRLLGPGTYQLPLRFHFGKPITVAVSCQVDADARELASGAPAGAKTAESLGEQWIAWGGVSAVRLVNGGPVNNFAITADSGYDYANGTKLTTGVEPGRSLLIGALDYSDTFTGTEDGGRPDRPYLAAAQPVTAYAVENVYGNPPVRFAFNAPFSFAADKSGTPGLVNGSPPYPLALAPNANGAGSASGFAQTSENFDYALPYHGLRSHFVVQVDAVQTGDRVDISCGAGPGIFAPQSLSIFFRGDGSGNASLFNGSVDTVIRDELPAFNTGITGRGQWNNYAVRFDLPAHQIELYVNQRSVGRIDLTTFAGGLYQNVSAAWVGAGAGLGPGENRAWTDNFQIGAPVGFANPRITHSSTRGNCRAVYVQFDQPMRLDGQYRMSCHSTRPPLGTLVFAEDFFQNDGGFTVDTPVSYDGPWVYDAGRGSWTQAGQGPENNRVNTSTLISPPITVPQAGVVTLTLAHRWSFERGDWDGGQIRLSVNGSAFNLVPASAFTQNGYNGSVVTTGRSAAAGQAAFVGDSPNFAAGPTVSVCSLGTFAAGDSLRVALMAASDTNTQGPSQPNWELDNLELRVADAVLTPILEDRPITVTSIRYGESSNVVQLTISPDRWPDANLCCLTVTGAHSADGLPVDPNVSSHCFRMGAEYPFARVVFERYDDVGDGSLESFLHSPKFLNHQPDAVAIDSTGYFESPSDLRDGYGGRLFGYWTVPETGNYFFWMASDDQGVTSIATDGNPAHKVPICHETEWAPSRAWADAGHDDNAHRGHPPSNSSIASFPQGIPLTGGQTVYLEGLFTERAGGDNYALTVRRNDPSPPSNGSLPLPVGQFRRVRLAPDGTPFTTLCDVVCHPGPADQTQHEGASATFTVTPDGTPPYYFQWSKDDVAIPGATGSSYTTPPVTAADEGAQYCVEVRNDFSTNRCCAALHVRPEPTDCLAFQAMPLGSHPNPWTYQGVSLLGTDALGSPRPSLDVVTLTSSGSSFTGLNSGSRLEISLTNLSCDSIELTLVSLAQPAQVIGYDRSGVLVAWKVMTVPQATPETFRFAKLDLSRLVIFAPAQETLLLRLCCQADDCVQVTTTADRGPGSLRAAIDCANHRPGLDTITFAIAGVGTKTIRLLAPLPAVTDAVIVDGRSVSGPNAGLGLKIDGSGLPVGSPGLIIRASDCELSGLVFEAFPDAACVVLQGPAARRNRIHLNEFLAARTGVALTPDAGNENSLLSNNFMGIVGMQIDLGIDGLTPNDSDDSDLGPNNLQNSPMLTTAHLHGGNVTITGALQSGPSMPYLIEFYTHVPGAPGVIARNEFIASRLIRTDATGHAVIDVTLPAPPSLQCVTATATDPAGNTSEFVPGLPCSPRFESPRVRPNALLQIPFHGVPGVSYTLEGSSNLIDWVPLGTVSSGQTTIDAPIGGDKRFFRVTELP